MDYGIVYDIKWRMTTDVYTITWGGPEATNEMVSEKTIILVVRWFYNFCLINNSRGHVCF